MFEQQNELNYKLLIISSLYKNISQ